MWYISWLWPTTINRETLNVTYSSSIAHQYTVLLTIPVHNMPPMELDAAYQACLLSCELHSRSFAVSRISRLRTRVTQSRDSENAQRNLETAQILRWRGIYMMLLFTVFSNSHLLYCELVHKFTQTWIHWYSTTFLMYRNCKRRRWKVKFLCTVVAYQPCINCTNGNINLHLGAVELGGGRHWRMVI